MAEHAAPHRPALLRAHETEIHELRHIATLLRFVTDEGGSINPETAGALSFLAYLATDRTEALCNALEGAPHVD